MLSIFSSLISIFGFNIEYIYDNSIYVHVEKECGKLKISCGTDIIEIDRIKKSIDRQGNKFIETIFTKKEIEYCENHKENKYQHYAARLIL